MLSKAIESSIFSSCLSSNSKQTANSETQKTDTMVSSISANLSQREGKSSSLSPRVSLITKDTHSSDVTGAASSSSSSSSSSDQSHRSFDLLKQHVLAKSQSEEISGASDTDNIKLKESLQKLFITLQKDLEKETTENNRLKALITKLCGEFDIEKLWDTLNKLKNNCTEASLTYPGVSYTTSSLLMHINLLRTKNILFETIFQKLKISPIILEDCEKDLEDSTTVTALNFKNIRLQREISYVKMENHICRQHLLDHNIDPDLGTRDIILSPASLSSSVTNQ